MLRKFSCLSLLAISSLWIVGIFLGCSSSPGRDEVFARINGKPVTVKDYLILFDTLKPKELSIAGRERSEIKNLVIKNLVRRAVIITEAEKRNLKLTDAELENGIKKFKEGYTATGFEESLLEQMVDENEWKEQIRQNLLVAKIFEATAPPIPKPSLKEALEFYEENQTLFHQKARSTALQIVLSERKVAEEIRKKLLQSPNEFITLAKARSIGPEAQKDCKIVIDKDTLPEEIDQVLFESKIGEISPIIQSSYGFHILKVLQRTPSLNKDFEEVKTQINERLIEESRQSWLLHFEEKLIRSAAIEYNRNLITKL